jgi:hypothetical protein
VAATSKQLCEITNVSNEVLRHKYIDPLVNQGIINKARSNIRKNENIYWPADSEGQNIFSLFKDENFKLRVMDPRRYPSKGFIIDSFRQTGIFGEMFGDNDRSIFKKNIFDIYRLEDENGLEITLEELAKRYFSDPETCFIEDYDKPESVYRNDYTKMVLLNSVLPRSSNIIVESSSYIENFSIEKIGQNTPASVVEDLAEHFDENSNPADSADSSKFGYDCYYCTKQRKKRLRTNDRAEYENHILTKHAHKLCYPNKGIHRQVWVNPTGQTMGK